MCQGSVLIYKESHSPVLSLLAAVLLQSNGTKPGFLPLNDVQQVIWVHTNEVTGVYSSSGAEPHDKNLLNAFCAITVLQEHLVTLYTKENQYFPLKPSWVIDLNFLWSVPIHMQCVTKQSYQFLIFKDHRRCLQISILQPELLSIRIASLQLWFASTSWHYSVNLNSIQIQFRRKSPCRSKLLQTSSFSAALTAWVGHTNLFILLLTGKGYYSESPVCNIKLTHASSAHLRLCKNEFLTHTSVTWSLAEGNLGLAH